MTGQSDVDTVGPVVLIDAWEDGTVENVGWVEVRGDVDSAERAVEVMEQHFPLEDRAEEEQYVCEGKQSRLAPVDEERWEVTEDEEASLFWVVYVTCKV